MLDTKNNAHIGDVVKKDEVYNTFGAEKPNDNRRCHITGFFNKPGSLPYQKFNLKTLRPDNPEKTVSEIAGNMHEFNISLDEENSQLKLKNVCDEEIVITKTTQGAYINIANDQENIKLAPNQTYVLDLSLTQKAFARDVVGVLRDSIGIQYQANNKNLHSEIIMGITQICPTAEECSNEPIPEISAMVGISDLGDGKYQIGMIVKNNDQHQRYIKLTDNHNITLTDIYGNEHQLDIDKSDISYAEECPKGKLSDDECLVTVTGKIDSADTTYQSFIANISYKDENGEEKIQTFSDNMPEMKIVDQKLKMESDNYGDYIVTLKNNSGKNLTIDEVYLESQCLETNYTLGNVELNTDGTYEIRFQINTDQGNNDDICNQCVVIKYKTEDASSKTMMIPLQLIRDKGKWYGWNNYGWKIAVGTGAVVIITPVVTHYLIVYIMRLLSYKMDINSRLHGRGGFASFDEIQLFNKLTSWSFVLWPFGS